MFQLRAPWAKRPAEVYYPDDATINGYAVKFYVRVGKTWFVKHATAGYDGKRNWLACFQVRFPGKVKEVFAVTGHDKILCKWACELILARGDTLLVRLTETPMAFCDVTNLKTLRYNILR